MTAISINLPENITKESTITAKKLGISRTEFIKRAIVHELQEFKKKQEQEKIISSFSSMKKNKTYLKYATQIVEEFEEELTTDRDKWGKKKKS